MKPGRRLPIRLIAYFVLCGVTWIVLQAEWARGGLSLFDIVWILTLFMIFFLSISWLGRAKRGSERKGPTASD